MEYAPVDEHWGEDAQELREEEDVVVDMSKEDPSSDCNNGGAKKRPRFASLTSLITEYFPNSKRMNVTGGAFEDEEEWWTDWASSYRGTGGEEREEYTSSTHLGDSTGLPGEDEHEDGKHSDAPGPSHEVELHDRAREH